MDYNDSKQEMALMMPRALTARETSLDAVRVAAGEANGAARAAVFGRVTAAVGHALGALLALPRRHAVKSELQLLSDRELADIGLTRNDISHIYERDFPARSRKLPGGSIRQVVA